MLRIILTILWFATGTPVFAQTSGAENYPNRAVRVVVPFPPGGPTDTHARILADKLQAAFGQPFIVENKVGATGIVGRASWRMHRRMATRCCSVPTAAM
jgi:tripartite-type tricarboxylate transporter receptor subunit TctC